MRSELRPCGCESHTEAGQVVRVDTCPECLPVGSITWLIENGRQLELLPKEGVGDYHERGDLADPDQINRLSSRDSRVIHSLKEMYYERSKRTPRREE